MGAEPTEQAAASAVIVSYNSAAVLPACLDALATQTAACPAVVVDNGSTDASRRVAESRGARLLALDGNPGYAAANNRGLALVQTPFVLFLNPDTLLSDTSAIAGLLAFLQQRPAAVAVGPQLVWPDGRIQPYAFGADPSLAYVLRRAGRRLLHRPPLHDWATREPLQADWVAGTCLLARTAAVRAVGSWDEHLFMYFEDNDLCRRLRLHGGQIWYNPRVRITHLGGQADYGDTARRRAYYRSMLYYYRKHEGILPWLLLSLLLRPYGWLTGMAWR